MIPAVLSAAIALSSPVSAADFFPLHTEVSRTYVDRVDKRVAEVTVSIEKMFVDERRNLFPVTTKANGAVLGSEVYELDGPRLLLAGSDKDRLLKEPVVVFEVGAPEAKWEVKDKLLRIKGKSVLDGDTLTVTTERSVGPGTAGVKTSTVAIYKRDVGLIRYEETRTIGEREEVRTRELKDE